MSRYRSTSAVLWIAAALVSIAVPPLALRAEAQEQPSWSQFQGGPTHAGYVAGGPQPPYRVRWTLRSPAGGRLSPAVAHGDLAISVGREAVYGVDVSSGDVDWQVPRAGGPLSPPAIATDAGHRALLYLEGPGPSGASGSVSPSPRSASPSPSPPAATAGSASPTAATQSGQAGVSVLVAVRFRDRAELWRTSLKATARSGVTVEGGTAYVGDDDGTVYAVSVQDGAVIWTAEVAGQIDAPIAVGDERAFVVARNPDTPQAVIAAFDAGSGERAWPPVTVQANSNAASAPTVGGGSVYVGSADRRVHALDAADGSERWTSLVLSLFSPATALAFDDESIYAADVSGGLYRLRVDDGARRWSHHLNEGVLRSSPVVSGGSVLLGLEDGRLAALDAMSGHLVWQSDVAVGPVGAIALSGDVVIAVKGGRNAGLVSFEHDPAGTLVDVASPTDFDPGTTFLRYALAAAAVFAVVFVPGLLARRRFGISTLGSPDAEPPTDDTNASADVETTASPAGTSTSDAEEDA